MVKVALEEEEVIRLPDALSISCAASTGFQLSCCTPLTYLTYTASWSPGEDSQGRTLSEMSDRMRLALPGSPGHGSGWVLGGMSLRASSALLTEPLYHTLPILQ